MFVDGEGVARPFFVWDTAVAVVSGMVDSSFVRLGTVTDVSKNVKSRSVWIVDLDGMPFCLTITPEDADADGVRYLECVAINEVLEAAGDQTVLSANAKIAARLRDDGRAEVPEKDAAHLEGEVGAE